jgi:CheY-like chemotaxis protein
VLAESAQLERAIGTLIGNAVTHAGGRAEGGPRGRIRLALETDAGAQNILLHVDDDGPGIPPGERERVLRPFAKGDSANPQGFGLGLALCQRIVLQHRGRVEIGDSPLGGARISLLLPLLGEPPPDSVATATADAPVVLVVDDDADIRAYLGELLGPHYQVLHAADGEEGLRIAAAELPDAIVSDVTMPALDGIEMVRRLRREPETSVIPVIFLTAYGQQEIEARAFGAGGDQFLAKPFRPEQLLLRIERMFAYRKDLLARYPGSHDAAPAAPASDPPPRRPSLLERFNGVLLQRLGDPDLDIDELCRELGVSRATLYRRLESSNGLTPSDYIRNLRLDRAASLLRDSDEQVSTVAYAVGYRRLSAFTRSFTAHFGCAPSLYRRSAREASNSQA